MADTTGSKAGGTRPSPPTHDDLVGQLGPACALWDKLCGEVRTRCGPVTERWVYGGAKYGWSCRMERGKKGILYLMPDAGWFRVGLAISDAARDAVLASDLPEAVREPLSSASKAIEGWPVRLPIRTADDVATTLRLVEIKLG